MIRLVTAVYDSKSQLYSQLMLFINRMQAIRSFGDVVNQQDVEYARHPEDYNLMELGSYDDCTGIIVPSKTGPVHVVSALELRGSPDLRGDAR